MKTKTNLLLVLAGIFFISLTSCKTEKKEDVKEEDETKQEEVKKEIKKDCKDVKWSFHKGENGPENWVNLCEGFASCGGKSQSPINIETANAEASEDLKEPTFSYATSKVDIVNGSNTVKFNVSGENSVNLNGKDYKLLQFHFHALSEHTIDGKRYPIEVHFVHKHSDTDFAVIGAMYKEGKENKLFAKYLSNFPTTNGEYKADEEFDLLSILPKGKAYYNYSGSLTTPPCSEVVNWHVLKEPIEASKEQIEAFSKILDNNYRPVMPLNDRKVKSSS